MKPRAAWILTGCAITFALALLLAPRSSYEPGALREAHAQLSGDCAACHQPWRGPFNQGCINCHGDITDTNPHGGFDVTDETSGLLPGRKLTVTSSENLSCLSCHREHLGRVVDVNVIATFACTYCHKHPAIGKVPEHIVPAMSRNFFVRHLFKKIFDHYQHQVLIKSDSPPIAGGFNCTSCHLVKPVKPGAPEQMSFKWSGCAGLGCHITPQDNFMQMPASVGPSPVTIAYSGVNPVRHINAVFTHSPGHLRSACEECHYQVAASTNPDDNASLAIKQCFTCHEHQPVPSAKAMASVPPPTVSAHDVAYAATVPAASEKSVVACHDCHLFHTYGVVPLKDFSNPAPKFPPNLHQRFVMTLYVPDLRHAGGDMRMAGMPFRRVRVSPWWMGLLAIGVAVASLIGYVRMLPRKDETQEVVAGVAPQRATEVPAIDDTYQTSVRHLYIIGEAAGTASINLAMRSGRQVIEAITNELKHAPPPAQPEIYDVVIIGCGPAGLAATATAKAAGLKYATLEKMTPASTLRSYPRAKFVQATPIDIGEYGSFFLEGDNSREELIKEWEKIIAQLGLVINDREEVADIVREQDYLLLVKTASGQIFRSRCVVLAIGVRGNPRHLNLPGDVPDRVFYNLIEPQEFRNCKILVVGGGNAGAEVAQALAAAPLGNIVSYSFRSPVLGNVTRENAEKVSELQKLKLLTIYPSTALKEIKPGSVVLEPVKSKAGAVTSQSAEPLGPVEIENDIIFAMIGAELPTAFLKAISIKMVSKGRWQA
jgi:thioredoxin reductase (NADPH)